MLAVYIVIGIILIAIILLALPTLIANEQEKRKREGQHKA